ncbi:MAG: response regulator, partial [Candidatus Margulisiibacteriota bacterium]
LVMHPDQSTSLVIIDLTIGELSGLDALKTIHTKRPFLEVLMAVETMTIDKAVQFGRLGAYGFVTRNSTAHELKQKVDELHQLFTPLRKRSVMENWKAVMFGEQSRLLTLYQESLIAKRLHSSSTASNPLHFEGKQGELLHLTRELLPIPENMNYVTVEALLESLEAETGHAVAFNPEANVLIVEDEPDFLEDYTELIKPRHHVLCAENGQIACDLLVAHPEIDVILLDIYLPDIKGTDLYRRLRAVNATVEVVVVTAYAEPEISMQLFREGAYDYVNKPATKEQLLDKIGKALYHKHCKANVTFLADLFYKQRMGYAKRFASFLRLNRLRKAQNALMDAWDLAYFFPEIMPDLSPNMPNFEPMTDEATLQEAIQSLFVHPPDTLSHLERMQHFKLYGSG